MQPHKIAASRVLLFDRLIDEDPKQLKEAHPFRVYSKEQLVASIAQELARLLNTRNPQTRSERAVERTVLDYGLGISLPSSPRVRPIAILWLGRSKIRLKLSSPD